MGQALGQEPAAGQNRDGGGRPVGGWWARRLLDVISGHNVRNPAVVALLEQRDIKS